MIVEWTGHAKEDLIAYYKAVDKSIGDKDEYGTAQQQNKSIDHIDAPTFRYMNDQESIKGTFMRPGLSRSFGQKQIERLIPKLDRDTPRSYNLSLDLRVNSLSAVQDALDFLTIKFDSILGQNPLRVASIGLRYCCKSDGQKAKIQFLNNVRDIVIVCGNRSITLK